MVKHLPANARDTDVGSIPELEGSSGGGNGKLLQLYNRQLHSTLYFKSFITSLKIAQPWGITWRFSV